MTRQGNGRQDKARHGKAGHGKVMAMLGEHDHGKAVPVNANEEKARQYKKW